MTAVLDAAGVARGAQVTGLELQSFIGTGQTGRNARFGLTWDQPDGRPATVVGKFPSGDPNARTNAFVNGTYLTEVSFYRELAPSLSIRIPECHLAAYDHDAPDFVMIMEDLSNSRQGDQMAGLTVEEAALAVEQAVGLHAPRWGDPTLADFGGHRPKGDEAAMALGMVYGMMVEPFLDRLGPGLDADVIDLVRDVAPLVQGWVTASKAPRTVVHLDYRPDNFMFGTTPDAPPLVVVDWQTVTDGYAMWDLAYMIGGSFEPAQRAAVERDLLEDYRQRMATAGVDIAADVLWHDYRIGSLWGVVMTVIATILAAQTERGDQMLTTMAQRHGRHAIDLDVQGLLG
jgi:Phosphotransferase enzyme family